MKTTLTPNYISQDPLYSIWISHFLIFLGLMVQVDIGGHPPFSTASKQFSGNFGNLLFLAVLNLRSHFEGLNEGFLGSSFSMIAVLRKIYEMILLKHFQILLG
jgi:hypothetical protein